MDRQAAILPQLGRLGLDSRHNVYRRLIEAGWAAVMQARGTSSRMARVMPTQGVLELPLGDEVPPKKAA